jgi:hypothetical protein
MRPTTLVLLIAAALAPQAQALAQPAPPPGAWRGTPPPAPRFERVKPRRGFVWIDGNWDWRDGRYVWLDGHWERERPGMRWHGGRWDYRGDHAVWIQGTWVPGGEAYVPPPPMVVEQAPTPPPPPQVAAPPPSPGPGWVWIPGDHEWRDGRYVWVEGRWERERHGERWEQGHWDRDGDHHGWHPGGWRRASAEEGAPISIVGQIVANNGRPVPGVMVVLAGTSEGRAVTGPDGRYAFTGLRPGSYAVRPDDRRCAFAPDVMNLNNLYSPAVQNFTCGWR